MARELGNMTERHSFAIQPLDRFASTGSATIKRPTEITHFSYTPHRPLPTGAPPASNRRDGAELDQPERRAISPAHTSHSRLRDLHHDSRGLKYYYPPELNVLLCEGLDTFQQLPDADDEHLDGLLASLAHLEQQRSQKPSAVDVADGSAEGMPNSDTDASPNVQTDIITWRGMITKVGKALQLTLA